MLVKRESIREKREEYDATQADAPSPLRSLQASHKPDAYRPQYQDIDEQYHTDDPRREEGGWLQHLFHALSCQQISRPAAEFRRITDQCLVPKRAKQQAFPEGIDSRPAEERLHGRIKGKVANRTLSMPRLYQ